MTRIASNPAPLHDPHELASRRREGGRAGLTLAIPSGMPQRRPPDARRKDLEPASRLPDDALQQLNARRVEERSEELKALQDIPHASTPPEKMPLAGYLFMRKLDGKPVEGQDFTRLDKADDTVIAARKTLPHGRGNVHPDIERSNGKTPHLVHAGRKVVELFWGHVGEDPDRLATAAMYAQAGNCGEHASVALVLHAGKLAPGETAHFVAPAADHKFGEVRTPAGRDHDVVLDPWAYGPAIMAADGRYTDGSMPTKLMMSFGDGELHHLAGEVHERLRNLEHPLVALQFEEIFHWSSERGQPHPLSLYDPIPVLSDAFCARAEAHLDAVVRPRRPPGLLNAVAAAVQAVLQRPDFRRRSELRLELEAAAVLRSMGEDVRGATTEAAGVVYHARLLTQGAEEVSSCI